MTPVPIKTRSLVILWLSYFMLDHTCDGIASIIQIMVPFELDLGAIIPQGNGKVAPAHLCFGDLAVP